MKEKPKVIPLSEEHIPEAWYNVLPDLANPLAPPLHPVTRQPIGPDDLAPLFPMGLIVQEVSQERYIEIPEEVQDIYKIWRPTPLVPRRQGWRRHWIRRRASTTSTRGKPGGQPQAQHRDRPGLLQQEGRRQAAHHRDRRGAVGKRPGLACNFFDLECKVYMVQGRATTQKPYRRIAHGDLGRQGACPAPAPTTESGRKMLAEDPDSPGSLGIAISEAVERSPSSHDDTKYSLGSVLNHVLLHQTVIGLEARSSWRWSATTRTWSSAASAAVPTSAASPCPS